MYWNFLGSLTPIVISTLNSNIRCIEINKSHFYQVVFRMLNSNIRCIEILDLNLENGELNGWIVTLDVLKWPWGDGIRFNLCCWIVTLDVLKYGIFGGRNNSSLVEK